MNNTNTTEWIKKAKKLAGEYAHCYAFVGDDTMPRKHKELMDHLESVVDIVDELKQLKAHIDNGIRVYVKSDIDEPTNTKYYWIDDEDNHPNATLIIDDGVEL